MNDLRKAAEMALEALERLDRWLALRYGQELTQPEKDVVEALRKALAEPEQRMSVEGSGKLTTKPYPDSYESEQEFRQTLLPVKTYAGGKPNYCTPLQSDRIRIDPVTGDVGIGTVDAVNMSQERVDETAKREHEPVAWRTFDGEGGYDYRNYEMNENYDKEWAVRNPNHAHWVEPLYTAPPKQEHQYEVVAEHADGTYTTKRIPKRDSSSWVGLTRRELDIATLGLEDLGDCYLAIEAKLKEKNGG
jgi:hypothetical protein